MHPEVVLQESLPEHYVSGKSQITLTDDYTNTAEALSLYCVYSTQSTTMAQKYLGNYHTDYIRVCALVDDTQY